MIRNWILLIQIQIGIVLFAIIVRRFMMLMRIMMRMSVVVSMTAVMGM